MLGRQFSITGKEDVIMNANSRETDDSFFKLVSVSEICKISLGGTPKTDIKDFWGGPVKWATAKDIVNNQGRYITSTERTISLSGVDNSNAKIFPKGTIVVTSRGTVGAISILGIPMSFNQTCYGLSTDDKVNSLFLYYALRNSIEKMLSLSYGTVFQTITIKTFQELKIPLPTIEEQQAIAKILSDLDEKIELNNQMNKTLENIAQAIFKRWFIDFEFPNENGESYKTSGGEMVESELGMIPKGWEVKFLEDLFIFKRGEEVGSKNYSDSQNPDFIQFYRVHDISSYGNQSKTYIDKKLIKTGFFKNDDILVSLDGTIGRVYFGGNGAYSSGIRKIESKYSFLGKGAILSLLKSELFQSELILYSADATTIKHASEAIKNIKIVYNKNILEDYSRVTEPIFYMMLNNVNNNLTLINIRDLLLPKLMTGKIRVPLEEQNVQ